MKIEVSNGEILDKVSILAIKLERITDVEKRLNVQNEWDALQEAVQRITSLANPLDEFNKAVAGLRATNEALWDVEDALVESG